MEPALWQASSASDVLRDSVIPEPRGLPDFRPSADELDAVQTSVFRAHFRIAMNPEPMLDYSLLSRAIRHSLDGRGAWIRFAESGEVDVAFAVLTNAADEMRRLQDFAKEVAATLEHADARVIGSSIQEVDVEEVLASVGERSARLVPVEDNDSLT
ncbi:hypothetical protein [Gordonia sp. N1V]|uniref:hypothetical protein n=1 Tax=Gordonia sp. N1V TaxID=3034163 RepID=UPI0023E16BFC|nr:hypothetical protein [Gordonia sp. N1V]MDF3285481.1 hypothetical protein [Gordonia sp. N1V]